MYHRRKTDLLVADLIKTGQSSESMLTEIVALYKRLITLKLEGYKIMSYKEKLSTYEMKEVL